MALPEWIKRTARFLLDLVELYIPMAAFSVMFLSFILTIFYRYVLNTPLTWPHEVQVLGFVWTAVLGATYARRRHVHVKFTLLYERSSPRMQTITRIAGNSLIGIIFLISLYPSFDYVQFMAFQRTTVLRVPFNIAYGPYVAFLVLIIAHCAYDVVTDIRQLLREGR